MMKYMSVNAMFENKTGPDINTFNNINDDLFTWKQYDIEWSVNQQDIAEFKLNLTDVTL